MIAQELKELFIRDLNRLKKEISLYKNESTMWVLNEEIKNTAGNLALHLCGNLKHFIGATLNGSDYKREREKEFSNKNISSEEIKKNIDESIDVVENYFDGVNENDFDKLFPINVFKKEMTTRHMIIHLYGHLNYHLGQINYHRRLLDAHA
ncbi:MAG: DUF1572 family protein [Bacteroidia bacterium]|nr:DUF1572 family protein [Bacteroidia bacterium]